MYRPFFAEKEAARRPPLLFGFSYRLHYAQLKARFLETRTAAPHRVTRAITM